MSNNEAADVYSGWAPDLHGLLAVLVLASATASVLLICCARQTRRLLFLYSRTWFLPDASQRPTTANADFSLKALLNLPQPYKLDIQHQICSDEELFLRFLSFVARLIVSALLFSSATVFTTCIIGVPALRPSSEPLFYAGHQSGRYPSIDQISLHRLFRAHDLDQPIQGLSAQGRFAVLAALGAAGCGLAWWTCSRELRAVAQHRTRFARERVTHEIGFFDTKLLPAWKGVGEDKARWITALCGLQQHQQHQQQQQRSTHPASTSTPIGDQESAAASVSPVQITHLHAVPDTRVISKLLKRRTKTLNELEEIEVAYMLSFEPVPDTESALNLDLYADPSPHPTDKFLPSASSPFRPLSRLKKESNSNSSFESPAPSALPSQSFSIRARPSPLHSPSRPSTARKRKLSEPLLEAIGKRMPQGSFVELFQPAQYHQDQLYDCELTTLGSKINVDSSGRFVTVPDTPRASLNLLEGPSTAPARPKEPSADVRSESEFSLSRPPGIDRSNHNPSPQTRSTTVARRSPSPQDSLRPAFSIGDPESNTLPGTSSASPTIFTHRRQYSASLRPVAGVTSSQLSDMHARIRQLRSDLRAENDELSRLQEKMKTECDEGSENLKGFILAGKGLRAIPHVSVFEGNSRDDVLWQRLGASRKRTTRFYVVMMGAAGGVLLASLPIATMVVTNLPGVADALGFLKPVVNQGGLVVGIFTLVLPVCLFCMVFTSAQLGIYFLTGSDSAMSKTCLKARQTSNLLLISLTCSVFFGFGVAAVIGSLKNIERNTAVTSVLAEIAISAAPLFIGTGIFYALVAPVALITRPFRYLSVRRAFLNAKTPRQRFQALFPQTVTRTAVVSCLLMLCFSAFIYAFIQPLVLVPVAAFSILLLPPVRLDVHYVAIRATQSGGVHELMYLRALLFVIALAPLLPGILLLSRHQWASSGVLFGSSALYLAASLLASYQVSKTTKVSLDKDTKIRIEAFLQASQTELRLGEKRQQETPLPTRTKRASLASLLPGRRRSWASLMDAFSSSSSNPANSSEGTSPRPAFDSEMIDANATPLLAARTHEYAAPHLSEERDAEESLVRASLNHPLLTVPQSLVWLPQSDHLVEGESNDCNLYGLQTTWRNSVPFDILR